METTEEENIRNAYKNGIKEAQKDEIEFLENLKAKLIGLNMFLVGHTEIDVKDILEEIQAKQELLASIQNNSQHNTPITTKEGETKRGKIVEGLPENYFNNNTSDADTSISGAGGRVS